MSGMQGFNGMGGGMCNMGSGGMGGMPGGGMMGGGMGMGHPPPADPAAMMGLDSFVNAR